jgi:PPM family protein phosphatase
MTVNCSKAKPGIEIASLSDVGCQRANNEDSYLYWEPDSEEEFCRKGRLAIIADGMGGYEGGQEASRLAVETVRQIYDQSFIDDLNKDDLHKNDLHKNHQANRTPNENLSNSGLQNGGLRNGGLRNNDPQKALIAGFIAAHANIQRYAAEHPQFQGMGTTCTAVSIVGPRLYFAHVGDSRLYLVRGTTISRLTRDHSYVGRLVESGIVRSEDAESHPQRHVLTAALGSGREVDPDFPENPLTLEEGDRLVLCTDGLWSLVSEHEVAGVIRANSPAESCRALIKMALERGGPDNVTVLALRFSA